MAKKKLAAAEAPAETLEEDLDDTNGSEDEDEEDEEPTDPKLTPTPPDGKLKVLKFGANWCEPCRSMERSRALQKLARAHPDITVEKVDCDREEAKSEAYKIRNMPTVVIEDWDGVELVRKSDSMDVDGLEKLLRRARLKISARSK